MKKTSKYLIYTAAFTSFCFAFQENRSEAKTARHHFIRIPVRTIQHAERQRYGCRTSLPFQRMRHHRVFTRLGKRVRQLERTGNARRRRL